MTPPVIVANAHYGLRAVLGYREVARLALLNNPEPLIWTKCALLISSFHLIPTLLISQPYAAIRGGSLRYSCSSAQGRTPVIVYGARISEWFGDPARVVVAWDRYGGEDVIQNAQV